MQRDVACGGKHLYPCELIGIKKGRAHAPGSVKGTFSHASRTYGNICENTSFGLYGKWCPDRVALPRCVAQSAVESIPRVDVKLYAAVILSDVSGELKSYDIEILKALKQKEKSEKSLVFRVTDAELLHLTGGIVQGMSGSPILQDGKLAGAVTHVFNHDPTKGFGLYADWMIDEMRH